MGENANAGEPNEDPREPVGEGGAGREWRARSLGAGVACIVGSLLGARRLATLAASGGLIPL